MLQNTKDLTYIEKKQFYQKELTQKANNLIEYYKNNPKLTSTDKKYLDKFWEIKRRGKKMIELSSSISGVFEDFNILLEGSKKKNLHKQAVCAYVYNYYILSCFLYLNRIAKLPLAIEFVWEEMNMHHSVYNNYSFKELAEMTELNYIHIYLDKRKK